MPRKHQISLRIQGVALPNAFASELRGRQSVRATFKLSEETINTVSIVAHHLGIKQKSLFDHLMDDLDVLKQIASSLQGQSVHHQNINRVQKTFVISRRSLEYLEHISQRYNAPRDLLVELSVQRLLPIIEKEKAQNAKRKEVFEKMRKYLLDGKNILQESIDLLGQEDITVEMLYSVLSSTEAATSKLGQLIEKGEMIEELLENTINK